MKLTGVRRFTFKWWLALPFSLGNIWRRLTPRDRSTQDMSYWWFGDLERRPISSVLPHARDACFQILNAERRVPGTSTTLFELNCILMALREVHARKVIEIGTFDGNTTLNMAVSLPGDGEVVTVDLPLETAEADYAFEVDQNYKNICDRRVVGEQFKGHPVESKIRQVLCNSAKLDWWSLGGPFDLAFIDGCHAYDYVKSDTENVISVMRPGGVVLWHDYAQTKSVSLAVDEFRDRFDDLCAVQGTRLAIGFAKG